MSVYRSLIMIVLAAVFASACGTVPETGRRQLQLVSYQQELQLGSDEFGKLKTQTPLSADKKAVAMVQEVGNRIAAVAPLPDARWEFVLFDKPDQANAFCLPAGKVGIYSGILPFTQNPAGLAAVIGHEVGHAVARHGAERISEGLLIQSGGQLLEAALQSQPARTRALMLGAWGIGSEVGVVLPHSRAQELEADRLGLIYMARAGYDPREAIRFWQRFSQQKGKSESRLSEFLSTHPLDQTRIRELESRIPEALSEFETSANKAAR